MTTVTGGTTAAYTFPASQTVLFTLDPSERAIVAVTRSGLVIFGSNVSTNSTIGPFLTGDVMSITALTADVVYTTSNFSAPVGDLVYDPTSGNILANGVAVGGGAAANISSIKSSDGTKTYAFIAGVIRNANDGNGWVALINSTHDAVGISSVTNNTTVITVNFNVPAGGKVITFVVCPDDGYAKAGYSCGASVGTTSADISLRKQRAIADYVSYNGSAFVSNTAGIFTQSSYTSGILTLTHAAVSTSSDGIVAACVMRDGTYVAHLGSTGGTTTQVKFYDWAGTLITTADSNMKFYLHRGQIVGGEDPSGIQPASANLWCYGLMELP